MGDADIDMPFKQKNPTPDLTEFSTDQHGKQVWAGGQGGTRRAASGMSPIEEAEIQPTNHSRDLGMTSRMGVWRPSSPSQH